MARFARPGDGFDPTKAFIDSLAPPLAERIAGVPASELVDRAELLLRHVRGHTVIAQLAHEVFGVVTFVGSQRHPLPPKRWFHSRRSLRKAHGPPTRSCSTPPASSHAPALKITVSAGAHAALTICERSVLARFFKGGNGNRGILAFY